jgi:hypothetical protein
MTCCAHHKIAFVLFAGGPLDTRAGPRLTSSSHLFHAAVSGKVDHALALRCQHFCDHDPVLGPRILSGPSCCSLPCGCLRNRIPEQCHDVPSPARYPLWCPAVPSLWRQAHLLYWIVGLVRSPSLPPSPMASSPTALQSSSGSDVLLLSELSENCLLEQRIGFVDHGCCDILQDVDPDGDRGGRGRPRSAAHEQRLHGPQRVVVFHQQSQPTNW